MARGLGAEGGERCLLKLQRLAEALNHFERTLAIIPNLDGIRLMAEQMRKPLI